MGAIASQITILTIVYSTVYSDADQRKHQSSASLAFVWEFTGTGEFPAQRASYAENVSIWWRHHVYPDSKVHEANMGPIWGRQDQGGPHVGPMNLAIWVLAFNTFIKVTFLSTPFGQQ